MVLTQLVDPPTSAINSLAFNNEGDLLACGSDDANVYLWSVPLRCCLQIITAHVQPIVDVFFSPDDSILVSKDSDRRLLGITKLFDKNLQKTVGQMRLDYVGLLVRLGQKIRKDWSMSIHNKKQFKHLCDNLPESLADLVKENMSYYDKMALRYEHFKERVLM